MKAVHTHVLIYALVILSSTTVAIGDGDRDGDGDGDGDGNGIITANPSNEELLQRIVALENMVAKLQNHLSRTRDGVKDGDGDGDGHGDDEMVISGPPVAVLREMEMAMAATSFLLMSIRVPQIPSHIVPKGGIVNMMVMAHHCDLQVLDMDGHVLLSSHIGHGDGDGDGDGFTPVLAFGAGEENSLLMSQPNGNVVSLLLSAWRTLHHTSVGDGDGDGERDGATVRVNVAVEHESTLSVGDGFKSKVTALAMYNKRYYRLYIVGYSNGIIQ